MTEAGTTSYMIRVDRNTLDRALTAARLIEPATDLAKILRQVVYQLAESTPPLPGFPKLGIVTQARAIAEAVHDEHSAVNVDWPQCAVPECVTLRDKLGLA